MSTLDIHVTSNMIERYFDYANFSVAAFVDFSKTILPDWITSNIWTYAFNFEYLNLKLPNVMNGIIYYPKEHKCTPINSTVN